MRILAMLAMLTAVALWAGCTGDDGGNRGPAHIELVYRSAWGGIAEWYDADHHVRCYEITSGESHPFSCLRDPPALGGAEP